MSESIMEIETSRPMTPIEKWMVVYTACLINAVTDYPKDYIYGFDQVPSVCKRMQTAFERGSYNKEGRAIQETCKNFGIKHTYQAINSFLKGEK